MRDPEVRYSQGNSSMAIVKYTLAVDRKFKRDGEPNADFINCIAFGKNDEFAESKNASQSERPQLVPQTDSCRYQTELTRNCRLIDGRLGVEEFRKDDVLTLYNTFVELCDYIECEVECGNCPLWENICSHPNGYQCDEFAESLKRIREALGIERPR